MASRGGIGELFQTVALLQNLRLQREAAELAQQQFGLQQQRFGFEQQQGHAAALGNLLGQLPGFQNPSAFVGSNAPELSSLTGASPELLQSAAGQTPPSAATQRAGAAQRGAAPGASPLDQQAAATTLTGLDEGSLAQSELTKQIFGGAQGFLIQLPEPERKDFFNRVLEKTGSGMTPSAALFDEARTRLSPEEVAQATRVGADLLPGASQDAQFKLGWANYRLEREQFEANSKMEEARLKLAAENARDQLGGGGIDQLNGLIKARADFLVNASRSSSTLTGPGRESFIEQLNGMNAQIRSMAPQLYGKGAPNEIHDVPTKTGQTISAPSLWKAMTGTMFPK